MGNRVELAADAEVNRERAMIELEFGQAALPVSCAELAVAFAAANRLAAATEAGLAEKAIWQFARTKIVDIGGIDGGDRRVRALTGVEEPMSVLALLRARGGVS